MTCNQRAVCHFRKLSYILVDYLYILVGYLYILIGYLYIIADYRDVAVDCPYIIEEPP